MEISGPIELDYAPDAEASEARVSSFHMEDAGPLNLIANIPGRLSSKIAAFGRGLLALGAISFAAAGISRILKALHHRDDVLRPGEVAPREAHDRMRSFIQQKPNISAFLAKTKRKDIH